MKKLIPIVILSFISLSCEKETLEQEPFEHQTPILDVSSNCDSLKVVIPGTYEGNLITRTLPILNEPPDTTWATFTISHIETSTNYIQDSLICTFLGEGIIEDTIYINGITGTGLNHSLIFNEANESVIHKIYSSGPTGNGYESETYLRVEFIGYK